MVSGDDLILVVSRMSRSQGWPEHVCWAFVPTPDTGELAGRILRRDTLDPVALNLCRFCGGPLPVPDEWHTPTPATADAARLALLSDLDWAIGFADSAPNVVWRDLLLGRLRKVRAALAGGEP